MAAKLEIYKCDVCGNMVEVVHGGKGQLVCCGEQMTLLKAVSYTHLTLPTTPYV